MTYDFTSIPDRRGCGSSKWDGAPGSSPEQVPLSTADMEFPTAPEIASALSDLAANSILGYTSPTDAYFSALTSWMERRHGWHITRDMVVMTPGVVYALGAAVAACTNPGDSVIILTPVYYPFDMTILAKERSICYSPLQIEDGRYVIDFDDLERKAASESCTALMFCNPHNPVGRVWTREELERVVDICYNNGLVIIDDEIHNDLIMPGASHTVMASLSEKAADICMVCTAPSKTFNLAGLQCSNIIVPNPALRAALQLQCMLNMTMHLNIFAYTACETAYNRCEGWLDELITVIDANAKRVAAFMAEHFPEITVYPLEGTYLLWMDCRGLGLTHVELERCMKEDAHLYLDEGHMFGPAGRGFERWNLACAPATIEASLERFKAAINKKRAQWEAEGRPFHQTLTVGSRFNGYGELETADEAWLNHDSTSGSEAWLNHDSTTPESSPTLLYFLRYFACPISQGALSRLRSSCEEIAARGYKLRVVVQSPASAITGAESFPFEILCDPEGKLFNRYNVFEADSLVGAIDGRSELLEEFGGFAGVIESAFHIDTRDASIRWLQLPAVFVIDAENTVTFAHYSTSIADIPDLLSIPL